MEIIKLNLIPSGVSPTCYCSQYDNGRVIRVDLFDGLTPYELQSGDVVTLNVRKPDNTIIVATLSATQGNTYVNIETTEQMCAVVGFNLCDLTITNGSKVIGTLNFIMSVERDVLADGIPSESVIEDLDALVQEAVGDQYYTKSEVDDALDDKADKSTTYTKTQVDTALSSKANVTDISALNNALVQMNGAYNSQGAVKGTVTNCYYNSSGVAVSGDKYGSTDLQVAYPYEKVIVTVDTSDLSLIQINYFDSSKNWISQKNAPAIGVNTVSDIVPLGASYYLISISSVNNVTYEYLRAIKLEIKTGVLSTPIARIDTANDKDFIDYTEPSYNKFSLRRSSTIWINSDGTFIERPRSMSSALIPIDGTKIIYAKTSRVIRFGVSWFTANKTFISRNALIDGMKEIAVTPVANAKYVVIGLYDTVADLTTNDYTDLQLTISEDKFETIYLESESDKAVNDLLVGISQGKYNGKKISILGDSISTYAGDGASAGSDGHLISNGDYTYLGNHCAYPAGDVQCVGNIYWYKLIKALGMTLGVNESWAGSMVGYNPSKPDESDYSEAISISGLTRIGHLDDNGAPDVIFVYAGTNDCSYDASHDIPLGTFDTTSPFGYTQTTVDNLSRATFADAYRAMLIRLMYYYPNAEIICMTPNYSSSLYSPDTLDKYCDMIIEICEFFGVKCIDARKSVGLCFNNWSKYFGSSSVHPNKEGFNALFEYAYSQIKRGNIKYCKNKNCNTVYSGATYSAYLSCLRRGSNYLRRYWSYY